MLNVPEPSNLNHNDHVINPPASFDHLNSSSQLSSQHVNFSANFSNDIDDMFNASIIGGGGGGRIPSCSTDLGEPGSASSFLLILFVGVGGL